MQPDDGCAFGCDFVVGVAFIGVCAMIGVGGIERPACFCERVGYKDDGDGALVEEAGGVAAGDEAHIAAGGKRDLEVEAFGGCDEGDCFAFDIGPIGIGSFYEEDGGIDVGWCGLGKEGVGP